MTDLQDPWVYLSSIPELETLLRRGLLSKVRIFEAWCENGDRLAQVIRVGGRPLALAGRMLGPLGIMQASAPSRGTLWARPVRLGMWLDMDPGMYWVPSEPPSPGVSSWKVHPLRVSGAVPAPAGVHPYRLAAHPGRKRRP